MKRNIPLLCSSVGCFVLAIAATAASFVLARYLLSSIAIALALVGGLLLLFFCFPARKRLTAGCLMIGCALACLIFHYRSYSLYYAAIFLGTCGLPFFVTGLSSKLEKYTLPFAAFSTMCAWIFALILYFSIRNGVDPFPGIIACIVPIAGFIAACIALSRGAKQIGKAGMAVALVTVIGIVAAAVPFILLFVTALSMVAYM